MAYTLRKDPGILTPYADDNDNNRRIVGRVASFYYPSPGVTTNETQTLQFSHKEQNTNDYVYTEIDSATVHFPNTQRARKQDEPYELTSKFNSASGRLYTKFAKRNIQVYTRSKTASLEDPLNVISVKDETSATVFTANANIPFLATLFLAGRPAVRSPCALRLPIFRVTVAGNPGIWPAFRRPT